MSVASRRRQAERESENGRVQRDPDGSVVIACEPDDAIRILEETYRQMSGTVLEALAKCLSDKKDETKSCVLSQMTSGNRIVFHVINGAGVEAFLKYAETRRLDGWDVVCPENREELIAEYAETGWGVSSVRWGKGGNIDPLPRPSALERVASNQLMAMTAAGYELEDVDGSLFIWCPLATELLFCRHSRIADWLRNQWSSRGELGTEHDCILIPRSGHLGLHYKDESVPEASLPLSDEEKADLEGIPFVYVRSLNRREVHICLPEER